MGSLLLRPRLGVVITSWSHEDGHEYAHSLVEGFADSAPANQVELITCPELLESESDIPSITRFFAEKKLDALCLVPGNFTLDHIMPLLAQAINLPTVLWGIPTRRAWGALVAVQQTMFPFYELGLRYRFVVGDVGDTRAWEKTLAYARGAALVQRMKGLRVGLMGWRPQGMSDVVFDELALREVFGVQVVNVGLTRYTRTVDGLAVEQVESAWRALRPTFDLEGAPEEVALYGVRSYLAMKQLTAEENLGAMTVECFHDHLGGPCLGCSLSNDEGIAASCESDVPSAVMMAAGQILSGEPTFHVDILNTDMQANLAIMHHCGNLPRRLAAEPWPLRLRPIPEHIGPGAYGPTIQATMKPGPVTVTNLVGRHGTIRVCALEAETIAHELEFPGSAAKVVFPFDLGEALEALGNAGYGHHFVLVRGHLSRELSEWCRLLDIDFMQPK
jgi:L-fucose isomerase-like protein